LVDFDYRVNIRFRVILGLDLFLLESVAQDQQVFLRQISLEALDAIKLLARHVVLDVFE